MPSSLPSPICEFLYSCTVSSGNRGIPVNVSGVDFKNAIRSHLNGTLIYGYGSKITCWDVSEVTNMDEAFNGLNTFHDPLCWDVSSVTTMHQMFYRASIFNQDLSAWDVSRVTNMLQMFLYASAFNQDLSEWDVSNVTIMHSMFYAASVFNQDLSAWDVSSITTMSQMFRGAFAFNQDLCSWASKSPQLLSSGGMFLASSCNNSSTPVLNGGTPGVPHDGPFCFTC
eukprot:scaffold343550_cov48-Attheya_sp.AAC.1